MTVLFNQFEHGILYQLQGVVMIASGNMGHTKRPALYAAEKIVQSLLLFQGKTSFAVTDHRTRHDRRVRKR
jgi:hypothetical protein